MKSNQKRPWRKEDECRHHPSSFEVCIAHFTFFSESIHLSFGKKRHFFQAIPPAMIWKIHRFLRSDSRTTGTSWYYKYVILPCSISLLGKFSFRVQCIWIRINNNTVLSLTDVFLNSIRKRKGLLQDDCVKCKHRSKNTILLLIRNTKEYINFKPCWLKRSCHFHR